MSGGCVMGRAYLDEAGINYELDSLDSHASFCDVSRDDNFSATPFRRLEDGKLFFRRETSV